MLNNDSFQAAKIAAGEFPTKGLSAAIKQRAQVLINNKSLDVAIQVAF